MVLLIKVILEAIRRRGYATVEAGSLTDREILEHHWLVVRGTMVDGIFDDDWRGRRAKRHDR